MKQRSITIFSCFLFAKFNSSKPKVRSLEARAKNAISWPKSAIFMALKWGNYGPQSEIYGEKSF